MERLEAAIARLGITGATIVSTDGMPPDAAIAKSLIWMINGEAAVLVLRQFDIVDLDLLERSLCCRGKLISRREAADLSGFEIGSIPPIGHALDMKVHIQYVRDWSTQSTSLLILRLRGLSTAEGARRDTS